MASCTGDLLAIATRFDAERPDALHIRHCADDIDTPPRVAAATLLANHPHLAHVHSIDAAFGSFETPALLALLASPHLTGLHALVLGVDTSRAALAAIARAALPALRVLRCFAESANVGDAGAALLAPLVPQLEALELWGCEVGDAGIAALCNAPRLRHLAIGATAYTSNPISAAVLAAAAFPSLERLELPGAGLTDAAFAHAAWRSRVHLAL